jgi:hypothetical protein
MLSPTHWIGRMMAQVDPLEGAGRAALGLTLTPFLHQVGVGATRSHQPTMVSSGDVWFMSAWIQRPLAANSSFKVLETCCVIGTWVRDHLLHEVCPDPLGVSLGVAFRVL